MNTPRLDDLQQWQPCQRGSLQKIVRTAETRRRRRQLLQVVTSGVAILIAGASLGVLAHLATQSSENYYGGIACSEVLEIAPAYMAGTLDAAQAASFETHLAHCEKCRRVMAEMSGHGMSYNSFLSHSSHLALAGRLPAGDAAGHADLPTALSPSSFLQSQ